MKRILLSSLALFLLAPLHAMGQGACYPAGTVVLDTGRPANSASVRVCTSGSTGTPCTPAASLFTDPTLGTPLVGSPTITTDARGNYGFCAAAGVNYDLQISGTGITPLTIKNLPLPPTTPIAAASLTSSSANPANVGLIKLSSSDGIDWRNNANSGNIQMVKTGLAAGGIPADTLDLTAFGGVESLHLFADGSLAAPAFAYVSEPTSGWFWQQAGIQGLSRQGAYLLQVGASTFNFVNTMSVGWSSAAPNAASADTTLCRASSGVVEIGASAGCAANGTMKAAKLNNGADLAIPATGSNVVSDTATQTLTNKTLGGTTPFNRLKANQGSSLVVGDVALSGGWGTTASVTLASGSDATGQINILSNGTGQAANATFTLTFHDGTWTTAPLCLVVRADGNAPSGAMIPNAPSATAVTFFFSATPVAATTYSADFICLGR